MYLYNVCVGFCISVKIVKLKIIDRDRVGQGWFQSFVMLCKVKGNMIVFGTIKTVLKMSVLSTAYCS